MLQAQINRVQKLHAKRSELDIQPTCWRIWRPTPTMRARRTPPSIKFDQAGPCFTCSEGWIVAGPTGRSPTMRLSIADWLTRTAACTKIRQISIRRHSSLMSNQSIQTNFLQIDNVMNAEAPQQIWIHRTGNESWSLWRRDWLLLPPWIDIVVFMWDMSPPSLFKKTLFNAPSSPSFCQAICQPPPTPTLPKDSGTPPSKLLLLELCLDTRGVKKLPCLVEQNNQNKLCECYLKT